MSTRPGGMTPFSEVARRFQADRKRQASCRWWFCLAMAFLMGALVGGVI